MGIKQTEIASKKFKISKTKALDSLNTKSFFLKLKQTYP
jgi:hypothetical protein